MRIPVEVEQRLEADSAAAPHQMRRRLEERFTVWARYTDVHGHAREATSR